MSDYLEAVEKNMKWAVEQVKEQLAGMPDDSDESFEAALDSVFFNESVEEPLWVEVCRRLGRENPW